MSVGGGVEVAIGRLLEGCSLVIAVGDGVGGEDGSVMGRGFVVVDELLSEEEDELLNVAFG